VTATLIGYARCSIDEQDITALHHTLHTLGVPLSTRRPHYRRLPRCPRHQTAARRL